jgi:cellulose synthase/poly-beta-1,6-N-acetylglucosamine synthase-like glycosyltransferase
MLGYQFILFLLGYLHGFRAEKQRRTLENQTLELPKISLMIPAHNEGMVITQTLEALLKLNYPDDHLEILVINDGSTDDTAEQVKAVAARDARVRLFNVPAEFAARGKSAALNRALRECRHEVIGIFDADNLPERDSVIHLARQLVSDPSLGAVIGKFRCINKKRNLLTRFINLESLAFQWIVQAGRWHMLRMSTLPGTNYLIRRSLLDEVGGWDEQALTEDAEMSIRIYQAGRLIKFVPGNRSRKRCESGSSREPGGHGAITMCSKNISCRCSGLSLVSSAWNCFMPWLSTTYFLLRSFFRIFCLFFPA